MAGVKTNLSLFRRIVSDPEFQAGEVDTGFMGRLLAGGHDRLRKENDGIAAIAAAVFELQPDTGQVVADPAERYRRVWKQSARTEALRTFPT